MKRVPSLIVGCFIIFGSLRAQEIKNVIFMIPDGTSLSTLSLARWYQYDKSGGTKTGLALDPYFCGFVKTHNSNTPIGDSAPTGSAYMTGQLSQTKFIGMYPPADKGHDLVKISDSLAYTPRMSVVEAARTESNKAIGLVFTCEFTHATPASTSAHWYNRSDYATIGKQMVHNSVDVVIGGGAGNWKKSLLLTKEQEELLKSNGYKILRNDRRSLEHFQGTKLWALFGEQAMDNDLDRDPAKQPSLAEMITKAIHTLSKNENGFFLVVEGSKIDWAAHDNDPVGMISEALAFDAAVQVAVEFAKDRNNTLVVVCPDHGNSGISIGNSFSNGNYDTLPLDDITDPLIGCKKTLEYLIDTLTRMPGGADNVQALIENTWPVRLNSMTMHSLMNARKDSGKLKKLLAGILKENTYIGFTTTGHTGEDVFLAVYDPREGERLTGLVTAPEVNRYLCRAAGLTEPLDNLTNKYYCKVPDRFLQQRAANPSKQTLTGNNGTTITLEANSNLAVLQEKRKKSTVLKMKTPAIFVDKTNTWYVSKEALSLLE